MTKLVILAVLAPLLMGLAGPDHNDWTCDIWHPTPEELVDHHAFGPGLVLTLSCLGPADEQGLQPSFICAFAPGASWIAWDFTCLHGRGEAVGFNVSD